MGNPIKPIETIYNGYRFRSRLEARWACFMDSLDIRYEYEKEGYSLPSGPYLPDFWLPYSNENNDSGYPNAGHWYEIKGQNPNDVEITKVVELTAATKHNSFLIVGPPGDFKVFKVHPRRIIGWYSWDESPLEYISDEAWNTMFAFHPYVCGLERPYYFIEQAILKARQARFEYGERG